MTFTWICVPKIIPKGSPTKDRKWENIYSVLVGSVGVSSGCLKPGHVDNSEFFYVLPMLSRTTNRTTKALCEKGKKYTHTHTQKTCYWEQAIFYQIQYQQVNSGGGVLFCSFSVFRSVDDN